MNVAVERRRLLLVATEDWYLASHRLPLVQAAVAAGYHVGVASRIREHGHLFESVGCELFPLRWKRRGSSVADHARALTDLVRVYRGFRPDVVHQVALKPIVFGAPACRIGRVPAVVNAVAGLGSMFTSGDVRARLMRPVMLAAIGASLRHGRSRVIVQNPDDREFLVRRGLLPAESIALIRGVGVDLEAFAPLEPPPGPPVVVLASRLLWEKGVGEFVAMARRLRGRGIVARFALVGRSDAGARNAVPVEQLEAWQAAGDVECWGFRTDMPEVLRASTVVVLPSTYGEGIPKSLLEAAACGRPIVTTDTPGCREVVAHGENGFLVPTRDVAALGDAVERLLTDPGLCRRMGRCSRARAEAEFGVERSVAQTLAVYDELLA